MAKQGVGSLTVVGSGVKAIRQLTLEAIDTIREADVVFCVVDEPVTVTWLTENSTTLVDLHGLYKEGKSRPDTYEEMVQAIVDSVKNGKTTCAVFYGHPTFFAYPPREAVKRCKELGLDAQILPGISCLDTLFSDFSFDPGVSGLQCFEATEMVVYERRIEPSVPCIVLQAGVVGNLTFQRKFEVESGLEVLRRYLGRFYSGDHPCFVYEAATFIFSNPKMIETTLDELSTEQLSPISTLFIPDNASKAASETALENFGISRGELGARKGRYD